MHFLVKHNIREVKGDQIMSQQCYASTLGEKIKPIEMFPIKGLDMRDELKEQRGEPITNLIPI